MCQGRLGLSLVSLSGQFVKTFFPNLPSRIRNWFMVPIDEGLGLICQMLVDLVIEVCHASIGRAGGRLESRALGLSVRQFSPRRVHLSLCVGSHLLLGIELTREARYLSLCRLNLGLRPGLFVF